MSYICPISLSKFIIKVCSNLSMHNFLTEIFLIGAQELLLYFNACSFSENTSSRVRVKPWFFMTFNNFISHIFSENYIEIPQVVQKI